MERNLRWKSSVLSMGGRWFLSKSVLQNTPLYFFSILKVPKGICSIMKRIKTRFFLQGNTKKNLHLIGGIMFAGQLKEMWGLHVWRLSTMHTLPNGFGSWTLVARHYGLGLLFISTWLVWTSGSETSRLVVDCLTYGKVFWVTKSSALLVPLSWGMAKESPSEWIGGLGMPLWLSCSSPYFHYAAIHKPRLFATWMT